MQRAEHQPFLISEQLAKKVSKLHKRVKERIATQDRQPTLQDFYDYVVTKNDPEEIAEMERLLSEVQMGISEDAELMDMEIYQMDELEKVGGFFTHFTTPGAREALNVLPGVELENGFENMTKRLQATQHKAGILNVMLPIRWATKARSLALIVSHAVGLVNVLDGIHFALAKGGGFKPQVSDVFPSATFATIDSKATLRAEGAPESPSFEDQVAVYRGFMQKRYVDQYFQREDQTFLMDLKAALKKAEAEGTDLDLTEAIGEETILAAFGLMFNLSNEEIRQLIGPNGVAALKALPTLAVEQAPKRKASMGIQHKDLPMNVQKANDTIQTLINHKKEEINKMADPAAYYQKVWEDIRDQKPIGTYDLMTLMLAEHYQNGEGFPDEQYIRDGCMGILLAAFHTTLTNIANILYQGANHPTQVAALRAEQQNIGPKKRPHLLEKFVTESLRIKTPAPNLPRQAMKSMLLPVSDKAVVVVPKGTFVIASTHTHLTDPDNYPLPDKFFVGRGLSKQTLEAYQEKEWFINSMHEIQKELDVSDDEFYEMVYSQPLLPQLPFGVTRGNQNKLTNSADGNVQNERPCIGRFVGETESIAAAQLLIEYDFKCEAEFKPSILYTTRIVLSGIRSVN